MKVTHRRDNDKRARGHARPAAAFTLIELLTVIFIISLLIGILIPSINAARNAAKKATTLKLVKSIEIGLEMFRDDNESDFRLTGGYPPSFSHPPIPGFTFQPHLGQFPFDEDSEGSPPTVYGAHWLPAMLMGVDNLGYIKRSSVPRKNNIRTEPWRWYAADPFGTGVVLGDRQPLYLDPGNIKTKPTDRLPGRPPATGGALFPDWDKMKTLPVIVDSFDQPVLYYVASAHGRATNMVGAKHIKNNNYTGSADQDKGIPFYFHQDNEGFTGTSSDPEDAAQLGWDFGSRPKGHAVGTAGELVTPDRIVQPENRDTFARYIVDRKMYTRAADPATKPEAPLKPVNAKSFLLITAGPDGRYGTADDVSNLPLFEDN